MSAQRRTIAVLLAIAAVVALALLWHAHGGGGSGSGGATGSGGAGSAGGRGEAFAAHRALVAAPRAPASLAGRVTRASDGTGVPGATVAIARADLAAFIGVSLPPILATTDATGAWVAPAVPPATYIVAATAAGFLPAQLPRLSLAPGEARTGVDLAVTAGGSLVHGTVTDIAGGPISGARIAVGHDDPLDFGHATYVVMTGADGTYSIALRDGAYQITAEHDAYTHESHGVVVSGAALVVDFTLTPGGAIRGQVVTRDTHAPVPNAMIFTAHGEGNVRAVSDADGNFTLTSLQPGVVSITAQAFGYASNAPTAVELGIGEQVQGVKVVVDRAFTIAGKVIATGTQDGVAGVIVGATSMAGGNQAQSLDPTGSDGAFAVVGVKPGTYILFAFAEDKIPAIGKTVQVTDHDVTDVELVMDAGVSLSGHVEPRGAAAISVSLAGEIGLGNLMDAVKTMLVHADAGPDGEFTLRHVPAGALRLSANTSGGSAGDKLVTVTGTDQRDLVITLEARASIAGHVTDTHHVALAGVHVTARNERHDMTDIDFSGGGATTRRVATTGADGAFKLVGLEAGHYTVVASRDGDGEIDEVAVDKDGKPDLVGVDLGSGAEKAGVVLMLPARDGVIRGKVLAGDGSPGADAWVTARKEDSKDDSRTADATGTPTLTDEGGNFTIKVLAPGSYTLVAEGPRGSSRGETKNVATGSTATIQLASLGTLSGHVTLRATPVATYTLACSGPTDVDRTVYAADGAYQLEHLAPGNYQCSVSGDSGTGSGAVDVPAGSATLELVLAPWATLSGTVVSMFDGKPVAGIAAATADDHSIGEIVLGTAPLTDATGRFSLARVPAGDGTLSLFAADSGGMTPLATKPYSAATGQQVDLGRVAIVPPRKGDAGTFGLGVSEGSDALTVTSVKPGGPAAAAGLAAGAQITSLDGQQVSALGAAQCARYLASGSIGVGQTVSLGLSTGSVASITSVAW